MNSWDQGEVSWLFIMGVPNVEVVASSPWKIRNSLSMSSANTLCHNQCATNSQRLNKKHCWIFLAKAKWQTSGGGGGCGREPSSQTSAHTAIVDPVGRGSCTHGCHPLGPGSWHQRAPREGMHIRDHSGGAGGQIWKWFHHFSPYSPLARIWMVNLMILPRSIGLGRQKLYTVGGAYRSLRGWYKIFHENGPAQGLPQALTGKNQDRGLINSDTQDLAYISKRERKSEIIHENYPKPGNSLI